VDLPVPARALAIGAHPDDIEFGCGATLAKWAAAGCQIHQLVLTDGSKGSWDPDADLERLVADRMQECRTAAQLLAGDRTPSENDLRAADGPRTPPSVAFLGRIDGELGNGADERRAVTAFIREVRPDVLLGHDPWRRYRLHPDHRAAGFLTLDALVAARDPHFFPEQDLAPHRPRALLLWEADLPNHVERAAGYEGVKIEALLCHHSQAETTLGFDASADDATLALGREQFGAQVRRQMAEHGALADVASGEAFHRMDRL
jgi:LmbE family N-acetylglucosaminyl deacetylase